MQGFRSRINPRSTGDLAIWIFIAMFFMLLSRQVAHDFLRPSSNQMQTWGMLAFVVPGLLFLALRKLLSREMRAELEAGPPGPVTAVHGVAMAILGAMSILVVLPVLLSLPVWLIGSKLAAEASDNLVGVAVIIGGAASMLIAPLVAGLWAGWRVGFAGWAFALAAVAIFQILSLGMRASVGLFDRFDIFLLGPLLASFLFAAVGGRLGSFLYRRKLRYTTPTGETHPGKEIAR